MKELVKKGKGSGMTVGRIGNGYRLCVGRLSGWTGHRVRAGITGAFGEERKGRERYHGVE